jgi:CRISPR-associated exonuclease Cas4
MFSEDDLLPLSGLQHLAFCERQWALIHIERQWQENRLTAEGRVGHERVHDSGNESRRSLLTVNGLALHSFRLGISGQADTVEFRRVEPTGAGAILPGREGLWQPFPVEHKRGKPKRQICDLAQLCAQALCLEEMLNVAVPSGALFYTTPRRRLEVEFSPALRGQTEHLCARMHQLFRDRITPAPVFTRACSKCSLQEVCLPGALEKPRSVASYLNSAGRD